MSDTTPINYDYYNYLSQKIEPITFSKSHNIIKHADKTIRAELMECGFTPDIIEKAVELHQKSGLGTRRAQRRKQTLFYFVLAAYNALGKPIEPKGLAQRCGLECKEISKAISRCSILTKTGIPNIVIWSPLDYIAESFNTVKMQTDLELQFPDGAYDQIIEMTQEILKKKPDLNDSKPQMVAAAIILYYLVTHGININKKKYASMFKISDMTINKIYRQIEEAYNA